MNFFAVDGVNLRSELKHVTAFVLRDGYHSALILIQVLVDEINVRNLFAWRSHGCQIIPKSSCQQGY